MTTVPSTTSRRGDEASRAQLATLWLLEALPAVMAVLIGFRHNLFDRAVIPWDFLGRMSAGPTFVAANIADGNWPSWNPFQGSGAPMATDIGSGLYYPAHWVAGVVGIPLTLRTQVVLQVGHVAFGAIGVLALLKALGSGRRAAVFGATAYAVWGGFYGQASHMHHIRGFAFVPWVLWALTPEGDRFPIRRLGCLVPLYYLIAAGAYPGQLVPITLMAGVYTLVNLWRVCRFDLRTVAGVGLVFVAAVLAAAVVIYPYVTSLDLLSRAVPPSPKRLRGNTYSLDDLGRFYFADSTKIVMDTWIATPVLVGLGAITAATARRLSALLAGGAVALAVCLAPNLGFFATLFELPLVKQLYPSRFVGADYKAVFVVVLIVVAASSWSAWLDHPTMRGLIGVVAMASLLGVGFVIDMGTTRHPVAFWAVLILVAAAAAGWWLALERGGERFAVVFGPARGWWAVGVMMALVALVVFDGGRLWSDAARFPDDPAKQPVNGWTTYFALDQRYEWEVGLEDKVDDSIAPRPARIEPIPTDRPQGVPPEAEGFIQPSFRMGSYGGHVVQGRVDAYEDDDLFLFLAEPSAFLAVACDDECPAVASLDDVEALWAQLEPTEAVSVVSYREERVDYEVATDTPLLVVENEMWFPGWSASGDDRAVLVGADSAVRVWELGAGDYAFSARYASPFTTKQFGLAAAALLVLGAGAAVLRRPRRTDDAEDPAGDDAGELSGDDAGDPAGDDVGELSGDDAGDPAGDDAGDPAGDDAGDPGGAASGDLGGDPP